VSEPAPRAETCRQGHRVRTAEGRPIAANVYQTGGKVWCAACQREKARRYYGEHREARRAYQRAQRERAAAAEGRTLGPRNQDKTHCPHGHAYTPENTVFDGWRRLCRACRRASQRRAYQRRKERRSG